MRDAEMNETDRGGRTPLHYAAMANDIEHVAALLEGDADVDAPDRKGFTALHMACQHWALDTARQLLDAGASVNSVDEFGRSPLFVAVFSSRGRDDLIRLLRERGADALQASHSGQTPVGAARLIANYDVAGFFSDLP